MLSTREALWMVAVKTYAWREHGQFFGADLEGVDLRGADLRGADLRGVDLRGACLRGADLRGADLEGVKMNWQSHELIGERLLRASNREYTKVTLAGGIGMTGGNYCWSWWLENTPAELKAWALAEMATWVTENDNAPQEVRDAMSKGE